MFRIFRPFENKGKPVQLVKIKNGRFVVTEEAKAILMKIEGKIGVVTVVVSTIMKILLQPSFIILK